MKPSDLFRTGELLIAVTAIKWPENSQKWPMDVRAFSTAADKLRDKGNKLAKEFWITTNVAGRTCPEFKEMLSMMHSAGLVQYWSPEYTHMHMIGAGTAGRLLQRIAATDGEQTEAIQLMEAFWTEACGSEL